MLQASTRASAQRRSATRSQQRCEDGDEQPLGSEPQEDRQQHEHGELQRQPDEAQIATIALDQPHQQRRADRGERQKQQQPDENQAAPMTAQSWNADGTSSSVSN